MDITGRQAHILTALIREYIRAAEPVGSEPLVTRQHLPYSPATVRSEFSVLEEEGYVEQPHTSAGRIPTGRGYRYFVDRMATRPLSATEFRAVHEELRALRAERERLARKAAKLLASLTGQVAVTGIADTEEIQEAGLPDLLEEPEFSGGEHVRDLSRVLEAFDAHVRELASIIDDVPRVYIGDENPFAATQHISCVIAPCRFPSGEHGFLAIVGPLRMRYDRAMSLLASTAEFLSHVRGGSR